MQRFTQYKVTHCSTSIHQVKPLLVIWLLKVMSLAKSAKKSLVRAYKCWTPEVVLAICDCIDITLVL